LCKGVGALISPLLLFTELNSVYNNMRHSLTEYEKVMIIKNNIKNTKKNIIKNGEKIIKKK
jgi:hypothetical protein